MKVRVTFEIEAVEIENEISEILLINHLLTTKEWSDEIDKKKWRISRARIIKCIRKSYEWNQLGSASWISSMSSKEEIEKYHIDRWKSEAKELSRKLFPEFYITL